MVEIPDDLSADVPACAEVPPATTRDDTMDVAVFVEFDSDLDEEQLEVRDAAVYEDLAYLEGVMFETA